MKWFIISILFVKWVVLAWGFVVLDRLLRDKR